MSTSYDAKNVVDLRIASSIGILEDPTPILDFLRKDGLTTAVDNLVYFNSKNDSKKVHHQWIQLAEIAGKIAFFLEDENSLQTKLALVEENERLVEFYTKLIGNLRTAYTVFAGREPEPVTAVLKVMSCLVQLGNRRVTGDFLDRFEFTNVHFHQLFVPSRDNFDLKIVSDASIRYAVVEFWLLLIRNVNFTVKMMLLTNFQVMNQFWKYLGIERYERLNEIMVFLEEQVLDESNFMRSTKCRILNENALLSLRSLFSLMIETPRESDNKDIHEFQTFKTKFLAFMTTLVSDKRNGLLYPINEFGSPLNINGREFKINNKLLHTLLSSMKPWEDNTQLGFAMTILNSAPELVGPYMAWLVSNYGGFHEPMLNSYWMGRSLLYLEILKSSQIPFSYENVALLPLSKHALESCLAFPNDLVKQIGLELVHTQLSKVKSSGNVSVLLTESIVSNLPPAKSLAPFLTHENRLLKLTATSVLSLLAQVAPKSSSSAIIAMVAQKVSSIDLDSCTSYDLVLLDNYLTIQSKNELKWWNKTGTHSFFTSLLLLSRNAFLKTKVLRILDRLVKSSLSFSDHLVQSPVSVLIDTLAKTDSEVVFNLLDETICRCLKSPYKYLDQSSSSYERTSIFLVVLLEQVAYLGKNSLLDVSVQTWLRGFSRQMILIGEPQRGVEKLFKAFGFDYVPDFSSLKLKKRVWSAMDFAETVMFLNGLHKPKKELLFETFSRLGDYCMNLKGSDSAMVWLMDPATFRFFDISEELSDSNTLAISLYNELLKQLNANLSNENRLDFGKVSSFLLQILSMKQKTKIQSVLRSMLWVLTNEQLQKLVACFNNELVVLKVYELFIERSVSFSPDLDYLLKIQSPQVSGIIQDISFSTLEEVSQLYQEPRFHSSFCVRGKNTELFEQFLLTVSIDNSLLYQLAPLYPKVAEKSSEKVVELAKSMENWHQSLKIFIAYPEKFCPAEISPLVFNHKNSRNKNSMTALFATFIGTCLDEDVSQEVPVWFHRAMLYVTRKFAECNSLSLRFYEFLNSLHSVLAKKSSLLQKVPSEILQAQAEVVLAHGKWVRSQECLVHISKILHPKLNFDKLVQIFVTNEKMVLCELPEEKETGLRTESALLLQKLSKSIKPTEGLLKQVVVLYNGTTTSEDLVIKEILVAMEARLMVSWIVHVTDWDFIDELKENELELVGRVKLITASKSSFTVTLNKNSIMNTIDGEMGLYVGKAYDPEFLIQLILNNQELVSEVEGQLEFDLEGIIGSHVLRFIVASLANPAIRDHCVVFLHGMLNFLERITKASEERREENNEKEKNNDKEEKKEEKKSKKYGKAWSKTPVEQTKHQGRKSIKFKHKSLLKIYIASILHTVKSADHSIPLVWYMVASFSKILINPGHFMYDRVKHYILSTPVIKTFEVPLFKAIMLFIRTEKNLGEDNYYRQVAWLVDQLACGVRNDSDLRLLSQREVMEWIFNSINLAYVSEALKNKVFKLGYRIQHVSLKGGEMLVARFGALTWLEVMKCKSIDSASHHVKLNVDQLALRFGVLSGSSKRLREWTSDGVAPAVKRIHQQS